MDPNVVQIIVWSAVIVASVIIEVSTVSLTSIWFAAAGIISLVLAIFKVHIAWQIVAFFVFSVVFLILTRPLVKKLSKKTTHTNADRIIDKVGLVTKEITSNDVGEIKIDDDVWRAITDGSEVINVGEKVIVKSFEGNKVIVSKLENTN